MQMSDLGKSGNRYSRSMSRRTVKWSISGSCGDVLLSW